MSTFIVHALPEDVADDASAYVHVHFAGPGCFACRIDRVA